MPRLTKYDVTDREGPVGSVTVQWCGDEHGTVVSTTLPHPLYLTVRAATIESGCPDAVLRWRLSNESVGGRAGLSVRLVEWWEEDRRGDRKNHFVLGPRS